MTKKPEFFVVGHSKSGTTALAKFLDQHEELCLSSVKEPNYFCPEFCRANAADHPDSAFVPRTEAEYLSLFRDAEPGQKCGEASAAYLYSAEAARRIRDFNPEAKIVMVFREPVSFLQSYHLQQLKNPVEEGETVQDLGEAIRLEPQRRKGREIPEGCLLPEFLYYTTDRIRYDEHYDRFAARFPTDQILVLTYDEFRADNATTVRRVYKFLDVDPTFEPAFGEHNTGGRAVRNRWLKEALTNATMGRGGYALLKPVIKALTPRALRRRAVGETYKHLIFEDAVPVAPDVAAGIREAARPHVEALGERLGRDLITEWNYDRELATP